MTAFSSNDSKHRWRFFRAGGFDQVRLDSGADLANLDQLDQKLWVALSCPTKGLEFDAKTLEMIDTDKDGRIRAPELLNAVRWSCSVLKDPAILFSRSSSLPLDAIKNDTEEGACLLSSARQILRNLGKDSEPAISLEDVADPARILANAGFNGDGVISADATDQDSVKTVINEIITCVGGDTDRGGAVGVSAANLDQFFAELAAYAGWLDQAESNRDTIFPLGEATTGAVAAFKAVKIKIDDFFGRCRMAAFDSRAANQLNRDAAEYSNLARQELSVTGEEIADFPLAMIDADKSLPLTRELNPAWAAAIGRLQTEVVGPLVGDRQELSVAEWQDICGRFVPHEAWLAAKSGATVEKLGAERVREILAGDSKSAIEGLINRDKMVATEINAIDTVEKLVRYNCYLGTLLNNFISFKDFYSPQEKALFQAGILYLDGRSCNLCLKVTDAAKHGKLAGLSNTYLAYCDCTRPASGEKMEIVAAFTGGDADFLMIGRNGIFYDRKGNDWDATITKIVDNPISVRQAFWTPYKKIGRFVHEQVEKIAASKEKAVHDKAAGGVVEAGKKVGTAAPPGAKTVQQAFDIGKFVGIFAAIGLAMGAIGSAFAAVVTGFLTLHWWQMPLAVAGILLLISGPSMIIAWLKLGQRNLGPILDASGWAVNGRAKINIPFGGSLTAVASLPAGAQRSTDDPYGESKSGGVYFLLFMVVAVVAALWYSGFLTK